MITLALREPKLDPGLLGEQVGSPIGHVAEFGGACGFLGLGQTAPASMSSGDTGDPGYEQSVTVRTILSHFSSPASLVLPLGLGGHPRALPCRPESHRDAWRSGDRPRPGRPCSRRLSPRARRGARGVACIPDARYGRRLAGFSIGGTLASGAGSQLLRDGRGRGADDLMRDGCCLVSSPEHGCLGGAGVFVRNGEVGTEPLGALPLGLGQAEPLTAGGLAAGRTAVRGRAPRGTPLDGPPACGVRAPQDISHEHLPFVTTKVPSPTLTWALTGARPLLPHMVPPAERDAANG
jgi:hypothetical protein